MSRKLCYLTLILRALVTLGFAQQESSQIKPLGAQMSLEQQGFKIIQEATAGVIEPAIVEENGIAKVKVKVAVHDMGFNKLRKVRQEPNKIISEDFEASFPIGSWRLEGDPTWGSDDYKPHEGTYSAWCARTGTNELDPEYNSYPNNCGSLMIYGPFSLKDVGAADLDFFLWLKSEINYDWFFYLVSADSDTFYGEGISGDSQGWDYNTINLNRIAKYGNMIGQDSVWVAFSFTSDGSGTNTGAFIDDIELIISAWYQQEINTSNSLKSVYFTDANTGWVVGSFGEICHTTDGGVNWTRQTSGTSSNLESVYFIDSSTGWSVSDDGIILRTTDGGDMWEHTVGKLNKVYFVNSTIGWAVGNDGIILKTTNSGKNWTRQKSETYEHLYSVYFIDLTTGFAVGETMTILKTTDGGANWVKQDSRIATLASLSSVYFINSNTGWVAGVPDIILKTTDGGINWIAKSCGTIVDLEDVFFLDSNNGWAVGSLGNIVRTKDGGENWTVSQIVPYTPKPWLLSVHFVDAETGWVVGSASSFSEGVIWKTIDGGKNWLAQASTSYPLISVCFVDKNLGWAVSIDGTICVTTNGGENWTMRTSNVAGCNSSFLSDSNNGWIIAGAGTILHTTDAGINWEDQSVGIPTGGFGLFSVYFANSETGWVVGGGGTILKTIDGGNSWIKQSSGTSEFLSAVYFVNDMAGWIVGGNYLSNGIILNTTDGGLNWTMQQSEIHGAFNSVYFNDVNNGWAVGWLGNISVTTNGGATWIHQDYSYPDFYNLNSVYFIDNNVGWAVGSGSLGIIKSIDGGKNWTKQPSGTSGYLESVYFTDNNTGWIVGGGGTLLKTTSSGIFVSIKEKVIEKVPSAFELFHNDPNPFNAETKISYQLQSDAQVSLMIYNILGQPVKLLLHEKQSAGNYSVRWNGKDDTASDVTSGVYIYCLQTESSVKAQKMVLIVSYD